MYYCVLLLALVEYTISTIIDASVARYIVNRLIIDDFYLRPYVTSLTNHHVIVVVIIYSCSLGY